MKILVEHTEPAIEFAKDITKSNTMTGAAEQGNDEDKKSVSFASYFACV